VSGKTKDTSEVDCTLVQQIQHQLLLIIGSLDQEADDLRRDLIQEMISTFDVEFLTSHNFWKVDDDISSPPPLRETPSEIVERMILELTANCLSSVDDCNDSNAVDVVRGLNNYQPIDLERIAIDYG
jgi:hypothetical protein